MELIKLPIVNHYMYMTKNGYSTFTVSSSPDSFDVQDLPLRFVINILNSDESDLKHKESAKDLINQFKFLAIKYFGFAALSDMSLKNVFDSYELPLKTLLKTQDSDDRFRIELEIETKTGNMGKKMLLKQSPLFIFTRDTMPDL
jgi:hypothetical protein